MHDRTLVQQALSQVSEDNLRASVEGLAAFPTRHASSRFSARAAEALFNRFLDLGYSRSEVRFQDFPHASPVAQRNILCGVDPLTAQRPIILVCAHYDSISDGDIAPGADDNATGIAAMLEVARLLRGQTLDFDLLYAAFGAEEDEFEGSRECDRVAVAQRWPIMLVLNFDMLGLNGTGNLMQRLVVQHDTGFTRPGNDALSLYYARVIAAAAALFTSLRPVLQPLAMSDHLSFEASGFVCAGIVEGGPNLRRHTENDIVDHVNFTYLKEVTQAVLAALLTLRPL